jgi:phage gp29-like protein
MPPKPKRQQPARVVELSDYKPMSQPSVRSGFLWTPAHLRSLSLSADNGDLLRLGELCEQMIADDRIGELLESLAGDVLGSDLTFEKTPRSAAGDAEKASDLEEDWPIGYDDDELTSLAIWSLMVGIGFAKHDVWVQHEGRIVPKLKWWHPSNFSFTQPPNSLDTWDRQWHVRDNYGRKTPIAAGDGTWVMLTRRGEYRPWANGLWRGLSPWWMLKQYAIQDWGVHSEKSAKLVLKAGDEVTSENRRAVAKYVYEASKDAVIALPIGFDLSLIELSANTREIYDAQIEAANKGFSIAIQGQNLTSDVQGGSRAAAEVHERKEGRKGRYLGKMLSKGLREQSLCWWAEYNYGDRSVAPYPHWHTEPPEDYSSRAVGLQVLADALGKLKTAGYKLSTDQLEEEYGVALEEVEPPPPPPTTDPNAPPPKPGKPARKQDVAQALGTEFLASGDDPADAKGFIRGQLYVDDLTEKQTAHAADSLSGFVDKLTAAIDGAEDYEQVRYAVIKAFSAETTPDRMVDLIEAGILLANLAGRHAVNEDAGTVADPNDQPVDPRQTGLPFDGSIADPTFPPPPPAKPPISRPKPKPPTLPKQPTKPKTKRKP